MPDGKGNKDYFYTPSVPAAYVFAVLFAAVLAVHVVQAVRYKTVFMTALLVATALELVGYITRVISIKEPNVLWPVLVSQVGLIVAPAFLAAQEYMIVGRIMAFVGSEYGIVRHTKITKIFVASDLFSILTQGGGGAILSGAQGKVSQMQLAKKILIIGLVLQIISFFIFLIIAIAYDWKTTHEPALQRHADAMKRLRKLWLAFYVSGTLITLRSIYRTVEFGQLSFDAGSTAQGYAITHEWLMYVFDAVPVLIAIAIFALWNPGQFIPAKKGLRIDGTYESVDGKPRDDVELYGQR